MKKHPWLLNYPIKKENKYLILGTHPPVPYCGRLEFYYGNMNEFWRFLDEVYPGNNLFGEGCPVLGEIQNFLNKYNISITDIVEETDGKPFSTDDNMNWTKLNSLLKESLINSSINTIYFTSFGGKNSSLSLFKKWLKSNGYRNVSIPDSKLWRATGLNIQLENKSFNLQVLFSPSPTARRSANRIKEFQDWKKLNPNGSFDEFRIYWYKQKLPRI